MTTRWLAWLWRAWFWWLPSRITPASGAGSSGSSIEIAKRGGRVYISVQGEEHGLSPSDAAMLAAGLVQLSGCGRDEFEAALERTRKAEQE